MGRSRTWRRRPGCRVRGACPRSCPPTTTIAATWTLIFASPDAPLSLFRNQRDGTFRDTAASVGLDVPSGVTAVAAGDVNKDDFPDFFATRAQQPGVFAMSDGRGRFTLTPGPANTRGALAAQLLDYDGDGLLDLLTAGPAGAHLFRYVGSGWDDVTAGALPAAVSASGGTRPVTGPVLASGDLDGDGDPNVIAGSGRRRVRDPPQRGRRSPSCRRCAPHGARRTAAQPARRSSCALARCARASRPTRRLRRPRPPTLPSASAGDRAPTSSAFSGRRASSRRSRHQRHGFTSGDGADRAGPQASSCPFLFTWNGERFEFVTDFMGGGEIGAWEAPGRWNTPDPDEYVRIPDAALVARGGRYEMRVTNELEETVLLDRLQLVAIAHPEGSEVNANEGLRVPADPSLRLFVTRHPRVPRRVMDHAGGTYRQGRPAGPRYVDDLPLERIRGYARPHD